MLIRSIRAEGFMRFSRLSLSGLPLRGIIGIEGPNETGKSTVGEILLFALFGRTRTAVSGPVTSLIRWGADSMSVEVEFALRSARGNGVSGESHEEFLICRLLDRYGTSYVKILKLPEQGYHAQIIAAAGYRAQDDAYARLPKVRYSPEDVIAHVR